VDLDMVILAIVHQGHTAIFEPFSIEADLLAAGYGIGLHQVDVVQRRAKAVAQLVTPPARRQHGFEVQACPLALHAEQ
jgi:hypothetical protein